MDAEAVQARTGKESLEPHPPSTDEATDYPWGAGFEGAAHYRSQHTRSRSPENVEGRPMKLRVIAIRRFLQVSSVLIIVGLLLEIVSVLWFHPLAFVLFVFVSATLTGLGIVIFLLSLVLAVVPPAGSRG